MRQLSLSLLLAAGLVLAAAPVFAAPAITVAEAGFADGPGKDYAVGRKLTVGSHVDVLWCGTHENWCLVDFHNKRGWLPLASLTFKIGKAVTVDGGTAGSGGDGQVASAGGASGGQGSKEMATKTYASRDNSPTITVTKDTYSMLPKLP